MVHPRLRPQRRREHRIGDALTWLCGAALAANLLMALGVVALLGVHGLGHFWQPELVALTFEDGRRLLGEVWGEEAHPDRPGRRIRVKTGNRDVAGTDFVWVNAPEITHREQPADAVMLERLEWGNFYGWLRSVQRGGETITDAAAWTALRDLMAVKHAEREALLAFERGEIGDINYAIEQLRLELRALELADAGAAARQPLEARLDARQAEYERLAAELFRRRDALRAETATFVTAQGSEVSLPVAEIVRAIRPNQMGLLARLRLYLARVWEFVSAEPRESNTEGGIFPAIFGTVLMVFLMSFLVAPFGVLAALYLREYAREGVVVRSVRIAVNNLAGVPSIVFGVFGLGFFVYLIGGTIDQLWFSEALPAPTYGTGGILWASLTLALLTVPVVIVATEEGLAAVPRITREGSLALGATKYETIRRVVLPAAAPAIMTGMILAMARAAGEVAPLMIVGMVKLAPSLPVDHHFPYVHLERKFMHLGFHVYDLGFQSPNVEAVQPLVFATAFLLVALVVVMNLVAILVRNRLRARYATAAV